jgi:hypothetical protein
VTFRGVTLDNDATIASIMLVLRHSYDIDDFLSTVEANEPVLPFLARIRQNHPGVEYTAVFARGFDRYSTITAADLESLRLLASESLTPQVEVDATQLLDLISRAKKLSHLVVRAIQRIDSPQDPETLADWIDEAEGAIF